MNQNLTDISVVLDRSGSMGNVVNDTIGGFNTFLEAQKEAPGDATLTLVQFDDYIDTVHNAVSIKKVPKLTTKSFVPRGSTALLDAIGQTVNATGARLSAMNEDDRPARVIFVILTDGEENSSKEFTKDKISEIIKHQTEVYNWDFVFLAANQDAIQTGAGYGMLAGNSMTYASNSLGTQSAFAAVAASMTSYRGGDLSKKSAYFDASDRDAQTQATV